MKGKEAVAVTGIGGYKIGSRRLMDNRRGGPTFSRFVPARGMGVARNGDEQVADDLKKLSIADKTEKEDTNKASTSAGKEKKTKKQGDEKKGK